MRAWIGTHHKRIAVAELILDIVLEPRLFDRLESMRGHDPAVGGVGEAGRCVGSGDVVADGAEVVFAQRLVWFAGWQTHVLTQVVGEVESVLLGVQA
ncbi:hypothetical protein [Nocardia rhizosphaerihabitans]|uniref:Uncharacterized protein n=1 Tax=Nocardia rhizosphaerihabitans TaxID=1691570 RepID=A0ABQ2KLB3_9NOCA|nr:hypothetical protein [Nocardia rhizosphaerihabitans]GGN85628.1 hypothetical protein GCM10011610_40180 [Nocardia rhizosphaerihabitans]